MTALNLRARVFLAATLPLTLAVAVTGLVFLNRHANNLEQNHIESLVSVANQASILAELPLAVGSTSGIRNVADFVERSKDVAGLSLFDRDGNAIESRGNIGTTALRMLEGKPLSVLLERDPQFIYLVQPVTISSSPPRDLGAAKANETRQRVGYLALSMSRVSERASIARLWWTGAAVLAATLLLSFLLAHWVSRSLSRPVTQLSTALSRVASGQYDTRLMEVGRGEILRLARDFNCMAAALHEAHTGLSREVTAATDALARRTAEAEAANLAKSRYLAAASHDLRQPAHALSLYIAALRQGLKSLPDTERSRLLPAVEGMQAASQSLDGLLNAVLDISRFDAGVVTADKQDIDLRRLLEEIVVSLQASANEKALKLRLVCPEVIVRTDPTLLRRIVENLVVNAIRFSRIGTVLVSARLRKNAVLLQIWDQGIGIAPENLPLIFEEFYQVRRAEGGRSGMGLGLAIVARASNLIAAQLSVRSQLGRGTCFSLVVPRVAVSLAPTIRPVQNIAKHERRRLFAVDDDPLVRDSMVALFQSLGYQMHVDSTAESLLPVLRDAQDDIAGVIVDYRLQDGFTGIDVARRFRTYLGAKVPIVIITGDTSPERLRLLRESGFPVVHKPLDSQALQQALGLLVVQTP